jgi:hypothetical protein
MQSNRISEAPNSALQQSDELIHGNPKVNVFGCFKVDKDSVVNKTFGSPSKSGKSPSSPYNRKRRQMGLDLGKVPSEDKLVAEENLTPEERSKRAQENWIKLKNHISAMRLRANFLVTFLDEENEMK